MVVCQEVYHCHPDDLRPEQFSRLLEYVALYELQSEEQPNG